MRGLLEFIRRLAEDDSEGLVAPKVLDLLWNVAHSEGAPVEIMNVSAPMPLSLLLRRWCRCCYLREVLTDDCA
jgi:hypothetical protein